MSNANQPNEACQQHCGHDPELVYKGTCRYQATIMARICGHECKPTPRICRRGVDGSPGCGHSINTERRSGMCQQWIKPARKNEGGHSCGHICDFSVRVPDERHEFVAGRDGDDWCFEVRGGSTKVYCGQPRDAACHTVEKCEHAISLTQDYAGPESECPIHGVHAVEPPKPECICYKGHLCGRTGCGLYHHNDCPVHTGYHSLAASSTQPDAAPGRFYLSSDGRKWSDERMSDTDNDYRAIDPIRKALEACEANNGFDEDEDQLPPIGYYTTIRKSDWEALKDAIK